MAIRDNQSCWREPKKRQGTWHEGIKARYCLDALHKHTDINYRLTEKVLRKHSARLDKALAEIIIYFDDLEQQPPALDRNVRMLLTCKFLNHIYSSITLTRCGLIVDAIICARSALETLAYHWLLCLDPNAARQYLKPQPPRPAEVRRRLQGFGVDAASIAKLYSMDSEFTHVGRNWERFGVVWEATNMGKLQIGGAFREEDGDHLFGEYLPFLIDAFGTPIMAQKNEG